MTKNESRKTKAAAAASCDSDLVVAHSLARGPACLPACRPFPPALAPACLPHPTISLFSLLTTSSLPHLHLLRLSRIAFATFSPSSCFHYASLRTRMSSTNIFSYFHFIACTVSLLISCIFPAPQFRIQKRAAFCILVPTNLCLGSTSA